MAIRRIQAVGSGIAQRVAVACDAHRRLLTIAVFLTATLALTFYIGVYRAPASFMSGTVVHVEEGETLSEIATRFESSGIVRSSFWLQTLVILFGGEHGVHAGDYYFQPRTSLGTIAFQLITGKSGFQPIRVTIPEGASVRQIADTVASHVQTFDTEKFIAIAQSREGYLFPDTYFFTPNISERRVVEILTDTFVDRIQELNGELVEFGHPVDEVVTMASILEREAHTTESRRIIAGILWNRIELGIPLQVDATFAYVNGKTTFDLTLDDLKIESPYNTYVNTGLPPGPIANPGLDSLRAAITPIESEYLYFLSDRDGNVYYSETFKEHKQKKAQYLN